jgi:hypothetical protein
VRGLAHALAVLDDQDEDLNGREPRRHPQAVVVAVAHDQAADHPGGRAPGRLPGVLAAALGGGELHVERLGEVLAQLVAGAHLQRLAVAHHPLAGEGVDRAGEPLAGGLATHQHG